MLPARKEITETELDELERLEPIKPTIDTPEPQLAESEVAYDHVRSVRDFVLSGPIIGGWGPGRYFQSRARAEAWCQEKYGKERVRRLEGQTRGRWSFLIKWRSA